MINAEVDLDDVKDQIATENEKTRQHVSQEATHTRQQLLKRLDEMPKGVAKNIAKDQEAQFAEVLSKLDELDIEATHTQDLIEIVGQGIESAFHKQPTQDDLLKAFQQVAIAKDIPKEKLTEKLKLSVWLIPTLLKYETDLSLDLKGKIKELWRKAGIGNMVF